MQENNYLLGAFGLGAQVWDREDANIRVSEHHADYFIRNQIAILAEERLTQTIYRPEAFVKGTFTVAIA
jgi:HK97 family phage major capsid protein